MYAVEVSDQIMIAHSFRGAVFGPAQELHGATFVVRAAFFSERLDENGIVVDIGRAHEVLGAALKPLDVAEPFEEPLVRSVNVYRSDVCELLTDRRVEASDYGS